MLAVQANLLTLLDGKKQFIIPIYQRTYSWSEKQCRQLWADIVRTAQDATIPAHFIGSVVYIKASPYDTPITTTPQMLVIDGQQRLTTLSLLIIALREALKASGGTSQVNPDEVGDYLINKYGTGDLRHKLVLTQTDKDTLAALIDERPLPATPSLRVVENYRFFRHQIQSSPLDLDTLFLGVRKLMLVDISLDRSHDNPQLIFESLNSTGLDLSQADLIRNFVLMGQEPTKQTDLYQDYWYPMERSFGQSDASGLFDRFMRDYLTIKMGRIPNMDEVYTEFKGYVQTQSSLSIEDVVKDVSAYARLFVILAFSKAQEKSINAAIDNINRLKVDVAYPFLMEAYRDFEEQVISESDFLHVLALVESYVFRRAICEIPTNSLNKTFAGLRKLISSDSYLESLEAALLVKDSYRRFPSDDEFVARLLVKDVYNFRNRNYLLDKLENDGRKEPMNVDEFTIEHIMPQNENLSTAWLTDLGGNWKHVQDTYLHTLGNLTLTRYNSEYSDRPFLEKRDLKDKNGQACGFAHSPLHLNQELANLDHWNENEIKKRAASLASKAATIWKPPALSASVLDKYRQNVSKSTASTTYTYDNYAEELMGDFFELFDELRERTLALDPNIEETYFRYYVSYDLPGHFIYNVSPKQTRLRLVTNIVHDQVIDPKNMASDATKTYNQPWAHGISVVDLKTEAQLDDVMALVIQALPKDENL
ncbi:hypothetical protein CCAX7_60470 [Capsulimonas corticalis]|uniref:Uncharacterized protein n=1 Tax=Capsulimonas corticalis TaxID=2219043 RepID=A0A402CW02_9BACT|nr:DUF262 and DUF1524 domain-containing protein [Capsulimonas corticalis]BDI33996.1 hypothetical protein CCAX7_60470 [Capsulimonas corticalis]